MDPFWKIACPMLVALSARRASAPQRTRLRAAQIEEPSPVPEVPVPPVPPDMKPVVPQVDPPAPGRPGDGEPPPVIAHQVRSAPPGSYPALH